MEGPIKSVDLAWKGFLSTIINQGDFKGELFESRLLHTQGAIPPKRTLLTGLGKKEEFDLEKWRGAAAKAGRFIRDSGIKQFSFQIKRLKDFSEEELTENFVTGLVLGLYQFNDFKTLEKEKIKAVEEVILLGKTNQEIQSIGEGLRKGTIISDSVCIARNLVNGPSNQVTPTLLAEKARQIAKDHSMEI